MENKLEVGMFVKIQWGNGEQTISKCTNKVDIGNTQYSNNDFYIYTDKKGEVIYKSMILKASHNIIDLIEVGDYVNGYRVTATADSDLMFEEKFIQCDYYVEDGVVRDFHYRFYETAIESIITKEQFKSLEYEVKK